MNLAYSRISIKYILGIPPSLRAGGASACINMHKHAHVSWILELTKYFPGTPTSHKLLKQSPHLKSEIDCHIINTLVIKVVLSPN